MGRRHSAFSTVPPTPCQAPGESSSPRTRSGLVGGGITTPGGKRVLRNLQRKAEQADEMFSSLVAHMNNALAAATVHYDREMVLPAWAS